MNKKTVTLFIIFIALIINSRIAYKNFVNIKNSNEIVIKIPKNDDPDLLFCSHDMNKTLINLKESQFLKKYDQYGLAKFLKSFDKLLYGSVNGQLNYNLSSHNCALLVFFDEDTKEIRLLAVIPSFYDAALTHQNLGVSLTEEKIFEYTDQESLDKIFYIRDEKTLVVSPSKNFLKQYLKARRQGRVKIIKFTNDENSHFNILVNVDNIKRKFIRENINELTNIPYGLIGSSKKIMSFSAIILDKSLVLKHLYDKNLQTSVISIRDSQFYQTFFNRYTLMSKNIFLDNFQSLMSNQKDSNKQQLGALKLVFEKLHNELEIIKFSNNSVSSEVENEVLIASFDESAKPIIIRELLSSNMIDMDDEQTDLYIITPDLSNKFELSKDDIELPRIVKFYKNHLVAAASREALERFVVKSKEENKIMASEIATYSKHLVYLDHINIIKTLPLILEKIPGEWQQMFQNFFIEIASLSLEVAYNPKLRQSEIQVILTLENK